MCLVMTNLLGVKLSLGVGGCTDQQHPGLHDQGTPGTLTRELLHELWL